MQAILPLAGKGTRLRPHTHTRPKPLLRVANRPVLDYVLEQLESVGVNEIVAITGHLADQIEAHLRTEHPELRVHCVEQARQLGTADAIRLAEPFVSGPVLIVFVDTLFDADLTVIERRPDVSGIVWAKEVEDYQRFGVIVTDGEGYMKRIVEKPREPISKLANIGVYYVRDSGWMFEGVRHVMARAPLLGEYFLTDAFQFMIEGGARLLTAEVSGWWDCGKLETMLETNREMLRRRADGASVPGEAAADGLVCLGDGVELDDATLGPNVSVGAGSIVRRSRLRDCIVGENSLVEDSDLATSMVGDEAIVRGVRGAVSLGDHATVDAARRLP
ncbi:MAG: sugar phosphate nucleotidyltransferase [Gemmatimonadota bacterium]